MTDNPLHLLFSTPFWIADIGDDELNASLKQTIYDVEDSDTDFDTASYPFGYTSYVSKIFLEKDKRFEDVTRRTLGEAKQFLSAMQIQVPDGKSLSLRVHDLFCNINRQYSTHGAHRHECSDLSAVYYVDADTESADFIARSPTQPLLMHTRFDLFPKNSPLAQESQSFTPKTGRLFLFPSWMMHEVAQQRVAKDRISLAFNLGIIIKSKTAKN